METRAILIIESCGVNFPSESRQALLFRSHPLLTEMTFKFKERFGKVLFHI